jgi:protein-tyrosine phosphatase
LTPPVGGERHVDWDGCFNSRDLGGLPTTEGRVTAWGAVVRSDHLDRLTTDGWQAVEAYGVRTIVDLRNDDERTAWRPPPVEGVESVHVPLDDIDDEEFWAAWRSGWQFGTPLYYRAFLERKPERCARAVRAVAGARPGGVVVHCGGGRDRTGLVAMLLLTLVGVAPADVSADYELSAERMPVMYEARGEEDQGPRILEFFDDAGTTARSVILSTLSEVDVEAALRSGGLTDGDFTALRQRLLD